MLWTDDDGLDAARGCVNGLALSSLFWLALASLIAAIVTH